jgi:hypothetical protein
MYRRQPLLDGDVVADLLANGSFGALAALVLFVRLSEAIGLAELRSFALRDLRVVDSALPKSEPMAELWRELFREINLRCRYWELVSPAERAHIVIFGSGWEGQPPGKFAHLIQFTTKTGN